MSTIVGTGPTLAGRLVTKGDNGPDQFRHRIPGLRLDSDVSSEVIYSWLAPFENYRLIFELHGWAVRGRDWFLADRAYYLTADGVLPMELLMRGGYPEPLDIHTTFDLVYGETGWTVWRTA